MSDFVYLLFIGLFVWVRGQDSTKICYPRVFQASYFNLMTEDQGGIYVDFNKEIYSEVSWVTGHRFIHDFTNLKSYTFSGDGNSTDCKTFRLRQSQIMRQCLPPYAKLVPQASGATHYIKEAIRYLQTWEISTEYDTIQRVVFMVVASDQPVLPAISQQFGYHGTTNFLFYLNHSDTISYKPAFIIPEQCATSDMDLSTIVG